MTLREDLPVDECECSPREIQRSLGRIEGKLDALYAHHNQSISSLKEMNDRVNVLERYRAQIIGWASAVAAIIAIAVDFLFRYFT